MRVSLSRRHDRFTLFLDYSAEETTNFARLHYPPSPIISRQIAGINFFFPLSYEIYSGQKCISLICMRSIGSFPFFEIGNVNYIYPTWFIARVILGIAGCFKWIGYFVIIKWKIKNYESAVLISLFFFFSIKLFITAEDSINRTNAAHDLLFRISDLQGRDVQECYYYLPLSCNFCNFIFFFFSHFSNVNNLNLRNNAGTRCVNSINII